jgi:hypothetical protein
MSKKIISIREKLLSRFPARQALKQVLDEPIPENLSVEDAILCGLWAYGFKIVPVEIENDDEVA